MPPQGRLLWFSPAERIFHLERYLDPKWTERLPRGDCASKPSPPRSRELQRVAAVGRWGDDTIPPTIFFFTLESQTLFSGIFIQFSYKTKPFQWSVSGEMTLSRQRSSSPLGPAVNNKIFSLKEVLCSKYNFHTKWQPHISFN